MVLVRVKFQWKSKGWSPRGCVVNLTAVSPITVFKPRPVIDKRSNLTVSSFSTCTSLLFRCTHLWLNKSEQIWTHNLGLKTVCKFSERCKFFLYVHWIVINQCLGFSVKNVQFKSRLHIKSCFYKLFRCRYGILI